MPLNFHVYKGQKTPDSQYGQSKYATDPNAATVRDSEHLTEKEKRYLARYGQRAMMRYKDEAAYFCSECWYVYNVICPRCKARSEPMHFRPVNVTYDDPLFRVEISAEQDKYDGFTWIVTTCRKCDFTFRVIRH